MSQWTHVTGLIRIESLRGLTVTTESEEDILRRRLGKPWSFEDQPVGGIPAGSEGSIQYDIVRTGSQYSLSWGYVVLHGDLRDYDDVHAIAKWLHYALADLQVETMGVRDMAVSVNVEGQGKWHMTTDYDDVGRLKVCTEKHELLVS